MGNRDIRSIQNSRSKQIGGRAFRTDRPSRSMSTLSDPSFVIIASRFKPSGQSAPSFSNANRVAFRSIFSNQMKN